MIERHEHIQLELTCMRDLCDSQQALISVLRVRLDDVEEQLSESNCAELATENRLEAVDKLATDACRSLTLDPTGSTLDLVKRIGERAKVLENLVLKYEGVLL